MALRIVAARGLDQSREKGRLGGGEVLGLFVAAEVGLRRRTDAVGTVSVVHAIQIELKDLVFAVTTLQGVGDKRLPYLPSQRLLGRVQLDLDQLLADGAAALDGATRDGAAHHRWTDAAEVGGAVVVEVAVLGGQGR